MKTWYVKLLLVITLFGFAASIVISYIIINEYLKYRTTNPPTTYTDNKEYQRDSLVFHWLMDKIDNGVVLDTGPNQIHGELKYFINTSQISDYLYEKPILSEGINGNSLQFNGDQWLSAGNSNIYNIDKFTLSIWVLLENHDIYMPTIMAKSSWYAGTSGFDGWWLCFHPKNKSIDMGIAWGNGNGHIASGYELPLGEWHQISVTMDNVNNEVQFYIDGKPYGKKHVGVHKWINNWNHDLLIAGYDGSGRWSWPGKIDDVRFYSTILSAEEIAQIYSESISD